MDTIPPKDVALARPEAPKMPPPPPAGPGLSGRLARIGFALAVLGTTLWFLYDRYVVVQTQTAVLAGPALTLRSPIEGRVEMHPHAPGAWFGQAAPVATIVNDRVDDQRHTEVRALLDAAEGEVAALIARLEATRVLLSAAAGTAESFRRTRLEQLRARIAEAEAGRRAAEARLREAEIAAARGERLLRQGVGTAAQVDILRRDLTVARDTLAGAEERVASLRAEEEGARLGIFATDNATDRSISQQTADRLNLVLVEIETQLQDRRARRDALRRQAEAEAERLRRFRSVTLEAPEPALLARLLVQPGEMVRAGQEVARLIACANPLVTADLDERAFRRIHIGQRAEFRPFGSEERLEAEVVLRLAPNLTTGEARGVPQAILRLLSPDAGCEPGRLGRVRFH